MKKSTTASAPTTFARRKLPKRSIGEAFGQHEPLTTRIKRLLDDYTDGLSVLKELVQNADDAGATDIRFLYDERTNEDAMKYLFDEGMRDCQGRALWVYNNAAFKDEDFVNIEKLSGATKENDTEKIGKFGLGFNAVYNLTDVPMFLSRNYFVAFDPHMSHLGEFISKKNVTRPGTKIDLKEDADGLWEYKDQFKPFNGIFGCEVHLNGEVNSFDGTLFRFPLRTREQAIRSEIKQLFYDDNEMQKLLQMFLQGANNLLIFTQNILRVGIYHLSQFSPQNPRPSLLFEVTKSSSKTGIQRPFSFDVTLSATAKKHSREEQKFLKQCNFLQVASKFTRHARDHDVDPSQFPKSTLTVDIDCSYTQSGLDYFNVDSWFQQEKAKWLIVSSMGSGQAMQFVKKHDDPSLVASAGVAVQLLAQKSNKFLPSPVITNVDGLDANGTVFCYLPLPIYSGLPVHVNGAFAVASNRRHLQEKLEDDKSCHRVKWNEVLMQDSVCSAFLILLEDLTSLVPVGSSYQFHLLWPTISNVHHNCFPLMKSFYEQLAKGDLSLFSDGAHWVDINKIFFLDPEFRETSQIGETSFKIFQMLYGENNVIIDLPPEVFNSFEKCSLKNKISARSYSKKRFFRECFFKNIGKLPALLRDVVTLHALDDNNGDFHLLIKQNACIPVSPSGETLKCPSQLVNPFREAASLFSPCDGRFPSGNQESYLNSQRLAKLEQLGMASDDLPWSEVAERAESMQKLNAVDRNKALKRAKALVAFMNTKLERRHAISATDRQRLVKAKFLPVLNKPDNFPLPWRGYRMQRHTQLQVLLAPEEVFLEEEKYRVCCTQPLVGVFIPRKVKELLELDKKHATLDHVIQQLQQATSVKVEALNDAEYEELSRVCLAVYKYMEQHAEKHGTKCKSYLRGKSFILVGKWFLSAQHVAFKLTADCSPFLFKLPQHLANGFPTFMKVAGVKQMFDEKDFISCLQEVKTQFGETNLGEHSLQVAIRLAVQLGQTLQVSEVHPSEIQERWGTVYLPDSEGVMRPLPDLCFKNCPWMPDDASVQYVNDKIPWATCSQVGVKTRREEQLNRHAVGIPYGQKEKLTNRLKRILTSYPCEKEILKELLQNADDAQATAICFIKDPRQHPQERMFEDRWKQLQGPALCVYNNKPFTATDIDGIQNLGEGSKGDDPNKTGQYGVGFNAVYHLTDAPSFISKGHDIGDVLCVFDPNCKYVPGASPQEPGRQIMVTQAFQRDFPNFFSCYLEKKFPRDNATMFRFPLRTEEMARESKISSSSVSLGKLDEMMEQLKKELFEVLLFVNNVKEITLCEVDGTSGNLNLVNVYTVKATMSKEDEAKRQEFADYVKKIGQMANERRELLTSQVSVKKVSYVLNITDNLGNQEKWLIVQQIGFEKSVKKSIVDAFKAHKLGMLPRGGVACLLEKKNSRDLPRRRKKVYCFLPLPLETNLPVHINGHFALDHEARRNLWRDEPGHGGYRSDWNRALLQDVVASCYVRLLDEVRTFLKLPVTTGETAYTESEICQTISAYETIFPLQPTTDTYWKTLIDSVFQELNRKELQILPVVRIKTVDVRKKTKKCATEVGVTWLPPTGSGRNRAFFNNLVEEGPFSTSSLEETDDKGKKLRKRFGAILLESGFNLVAFSLAVHESFQRSDVVTYCVSPDSVINFYKTFRNQDPLCTIGPVPCEVNNTVFESAFGVRVVLLYCKRAEHFLDKLPGLPLLLTQDNHLQLFSSGQPKILSRYHDLLPRSPRIFLHEDVDRSIFSDVSILTSSVLKPLDAHVFAANLPQTLSRISYGRALFVKWAPDQKAIPNQQWIFKLWDFLHDLVRDVLSDENLDEGCKVLQIKAALRPIFNWSILPVTKTRNRQEIYTYRLSSWRSASNVEHLLAPLKHAESVLDFKNPDSASLRLVDVLRKLGLPELNSSSSSRTSVYLSSNSVILAGMLVSSLKDPTSLLTSLDHKLSSDSKLITQRLEQSDCGTILEYFSRSVGCLQDTDRSTLRKLPFYLATHGGFISLDDARVCVLPIGIPRKEIDVLEHELGVVFVESWQSLSRLFDFLALECVSVVDVYCTFILKNFSILSEDARKSHLEYILKSILADFVREDDEQQRVLDCLRTTPLLPTKDGTLQTASCFYDPGIDVFRSMLSDDNFPSEPFDSSDWITFLRKIGLVHEVSLDHFHRFATELAIEAATARNKNTYIKSEVLIRHLICRRDVVREGWLQAVRDIAFVAPHRVRQPLQALCPPFSGPEEEVVVWWEDDFVVILEEEEEEELPFISFKGAVLSDYEDIVWTKAYLLPKSADPRSRYGLNCPPRCSIDQYCKTFLAQLQVVTKPTVDLVVRHCKAVCLHLESTRPLEIDSSAHLSTAMDRIYQFLQDNAMVGSEAKNLLKATPCILVEQGRKFIMPSQAVLELYEDYEIKPFLYRAPPEFGKFQRLFEYLGCSKSVKPTHYAMVLEMLLESSQSSKLHQHEVSVCFKAVKGFFESLQEDAEDSSTLSKLYLPAMPSGSPSSDMCLNTIPVTLHSSTELVFNDAPGLSDRIQGLNLQFVLDLSFLDVRFKSAMTNYKELIMRLPAPVQPVLLSSVVKEKLYSCMAVASGAVNALMQRLSRPQFGRGIARIMRDFNFHRKDFDEDVIANIEKGLQRIDLLAVKSLQTALFYNDHLIPGSKREVPSFKGKSEVDGQEKYRVYVNVGHGIDDENLAKSLIANVIADIYGDFLGKNAWLVPEMLRCPLSDIWSLLDKTGIRQDDSYKTTEMDIYPEIEPGTFIPIDEHHLLNDAFAEFIPGEFVGYQLHDPSLQLEEGVATYIYAEITEELDVIDLNFIYLTKMYLINTGNDKEPEEVNSAFLYKLHRMQDISHQATEPPRNSNREEVFGEISNILENAWRIPEEQRRQIVKRLVLRWHPEKNVGNEEFCVRAFEYIKKELFRLGGSHDDYIEAWATRAREHRLQRDQYRERFVQEYGPLESSSGHKVWHNIAPSFCKRNPQPGEARRWFRQAEADLAAGANDIDCCRPSYEWACFKCHQAAEKALKAAQYTIDADKTSVHNLVQNCNDLSDSELTNLARDLERLVGSSTRMRYPDQVPPPKIPNEVYSAQMAQHALQLSQNIVMRVKDRIT